MKRFAAVADDVSNVSGGIDGDEEIATATVVEPLFADEILTVTLPGGAADLSLVGVMSLVWEDMSVDCSVIASPLVVLVRMALGRCRR